METREICAQSLYELVELKRQVNPWHLRDTAEGIYLSVKVVGMDETAITYVDENGNKIIKKGSEIPEEMRAVAAFIKTLVARWTDSNSGRLEEHYQLPMLIHYMIGGKVYNNSYAGLKCISIREFIDAYLGM